MSEKKKAETTHPNKIKVKLKHLKKRYLDVMTKELSTDNIWKQRLSEQLNCDPADVEEQVTNKYREIVESGIDSSVMKADRDIKNLTFQRTMYAYDFFEQLSTLFQCNLDINEATVQSNENYVKSCYIQLEDRKLKTKLRNVNREKTYTEENCSVRIKQETSVEENKFRITDKDADALEKYVVEAMETKSEPPAPKEMLIEAKLECPSIINENIPMKSEPLTTEENSADYPNSEFEEKAREMLKLCRESNTRKLFENVKVERKSLKRKMGEEEEEEEEEDEEINKEDGDDNDDDDDEEEQEIKKRFDTFRSNVKSLNLRKGSKRKLLIQHLDETLPLELKTNLERFSDNIPKIRKIFETIFSFVQILEKTASQIPCKELDTETGRHWKVCCKGCPIHCIPNWHFTNPTGRPSKKKKLT